MNHCEPTKQFLQILSLFGVAFPFFTRVQALHELTQESEAATLFAMIDVDALIFYIVLRLVGSESMLASVRYFEEAAGSLSGDAHELVGLPRCLTHIFNDAIESLRLLQE